MQSSLINMGGQSLFTYLRGEEGAAMYWAVGARSEREKREPLLLFGFFSLKSFSSLKHKIKTLCG